MSGAIDVLRIQLINWRQRLAIPLAVLTLVLVLNVAIYALLADGTAPENRTTGGLLALYFTAAAVYLQTMTQVFPFALGLSITRRAFYGGVALLAVLEAVAYGTLVLLLGLVERATDGWGIQLTFFRILFRADFVGADDLLGRWVVYTVPFLALFALAMAVGVVFKRWGPNGVWTLSIVSTAVLGGLAVLITWQRAWPAVGAWFAGQPVLALAGAYPVLLAAALGALGWLGLRRATP